MTKSRAIRWDSYGFAPWHPREVARMLAGIDLPWYVAAGWALDLFLGGQRRFLGGQRREHEDIEIAVPRERHDDVLRAFDACEPYAAAVPEPEYLTPLAHVDPDTFAAGHQTWLLDPREGAWKLDIFREPSDGDVWLCRRDESIRMPYAELIRWTDDGIPYGRPDVVLLFKARHAREKDDADFAAVLPALDRNARAWLLDALERVHPDHRWLPALRDL